MSSGRLKVPGRSIPKPVIIGIVVVVVIIALFLTMSAVRTIEPGQRGVLVTWGAVDMSQVYGEGLHFVNPFGGQTLIAMSVQTQLISEKASAASKDLQDVTTIIAINFRVDPETVNKLYRDIGAGYPTKLIQPFAQEAIKQVTAQYNAGQLITQREVIKGKIQDVLAAKLQPYGILVTQVSITDFNFSPEFNRAVEQTATAQQNVAQQENIKKQIAIQAEQKIIQAEGQRNSTIAIAQGTSQAKVLEAQGQAKAIELVNDALSKSPLYLQYQKIQTWNGQLPKVVTSGEAQIISLPSDILANSTK